MGGFTPDEFEALRAGLEMLVYGRVKSFPSSTKEELARRIAAARDLLACIETLEKEEKF